MVVGWGLRTVMETVEKEVASEISRIQLSKRTMCGQHFTRTCLPGASHYPEGRGSTIRSVLHFIWFLSEVSRGKMVKCLPMKNGFQVAT